jgi:hypothetical protein
MFFLGWAGHLGLGGHMTVPGEHPAFGPDEIAVIATAFEDALRQLRLSNREDPATLAIAKLIIELAKQGERDPVRLRERALKALLR